MLFFLLKWSISLLAFFYVYIADGRGGGEICINPFNQSQNIFAVKLNGFPVSVETLILENLPTVMTSWRQRPSTSTFSKEIVVGRWQRHSRPLDFPRWENGGKKVFVEKMSARFFVCEVWIGILMRGQFSAGCQIWLLASSLVGSNNRNEVFTDAFCS